MTDARSETVTEKPSFRLAAARHRALIPANGYYEWQKNEDGTKTPHYLHGKDEDQLLNAVTFMKVRVDVEGFHGPVSTASCD